MLDDLARALSDAVATGRIGTPVALRVHVVAPAECDLTAALTQLMRRLAEPLFGPPGSITARRPADGRALHVLVSWAAGQTALATLARVAGTAWRLELLAIGNHGLLRLEGGESFAGLDAAPAADGAAASDPYRRAVEAAPGSSSSSP